MFRDDPMFIFQFERGHMNWGISQRVSRFDVILSATKMDILNMTVEDHKMALLNHEGLQDDGKTIMRVRYGYPGMLSPLKKFVIRSVVPDITNNGVTLLKIRGYDEATSIVPNKSPKVWERPQGYTYSEIAYEIAMKLGFVPVIEPTADRFLRVTQGGVSDIEFLNELAKKSRALDSSKRGTYRVILHDGELHFKPIDLARAPSYEYTYLNSRDSDFISFTVATRSHEKPDVVSSGIDIRKKQPVDKKATNETVKRDSLGKVLINAVSGAVEWVYDKVGDATGEIIGTGDLDKTNVFNNDTNANTEADNKYKDKELNAIKATLRVIGNPFIVPDRIVKINNVGIKYSGLWWVDEVIHEFSSSGYMTECKLLRNALNQIGDLPETKGVENRNTQVDGTSGQSSTVVVVNAKTGEVTTKTLDGRVQE